MQGGNDYEAIISEYTQQEPDLSESTVTQKIKGIKHKQTNKPLP